MPENINIITRSGSVDSVNSDLNVNQNAPFKQKPNNNKQLGVNFQRDRGPSIGSNQHSRLASDFNLQIDGLINGLNMKTNKGRGKQFTDLLFHNRYEFSSTSLKAMTKTMERLTSNNKQAKSDLKTLEKDLLKVSAGKTGIRAFGVKSGARAMALRQQVRNTVLLTYLKTGDMDLARQVKQDMIEAMTQKPPGSAGKSEFQQVIDAKSHDEIKQLDLQFNDITNFVENATPGELREALGKGSLAEQDLGLVAKQPGANQGVQQSNIIQVIPPQQQGIDVNMQIQNDQIIANELDANHQDLDNLTKGNIKPNEFVTKGDNNGVKNNQKIIDTSSDELISQEFFRNQQDLDNLTNGNIKVDEFKTKGNENDEGQVTKSVEDTSSDEVISQELFRNQNDLDDLTEGKIKPNDFKTGKDGEPD